MDWKTVKYYAKEGAIVLGSTFITFLPEILHMFPDHTLAFKAALPVSLVWRMWRLRQQKKKGNLPSGVEQHYNFIKDKVKK